MSYDIYLRDPITKDVIMLDNNHQMKGGTYCLGGTAEAWLNITYNYYKIFYEKLGEKGIRTIYGMSGVDSIPILQKAIDQLKDDVDEDYWKPTEGNVKRSLIQLLTLAKLRPDGIWDGD